MRALLLTLAFFSFLYYGCGEPGPVTSNSEVQSLIEQVRLEYAPDKRVVRWQVQDSRLGQQVLLRGETNEPAARAALREALDAAQIPYIDSIQLLPNESLEGRHYGLVNVSVANIRSEDKHWGEMATQALLGTPLKLLKKVREGWYYVQTPDGYLGYLDQGAFVRLNEAGFRQWQQSPRLIYWKDFGFSTLSPDPGSQRISDLVIGCLLQQGISNGQVTEVIYPDGRQAFVPSEDVKNLDNWLDKADPSPDAFGQTARSFVGRPYLWGGTSGKGMDCSGFTKTVFYLHGMILQRDASQQVLTGLEVPTDSTLQNLQEGDFLFFGRKATAAQPQKVTHVGIYLGNGLFIHSGDDNPGVSIQSLEPGTPNFVPHRLASLLGARRMWDTPGDHGVQWIKDSPFYFTQLQD